MKAVILAGGLGSRLSEETATRPKPMVEIGSRPILWHIMSTYSRHGVNDFVVCLGYKGYVIKEYFANYALHRSNVTFDLRANTMEVVEADVEPWRVILVDTGLNSATGGRLRQVLPLLGDDDFCMTYGDGVADVDIGALLDFHRQHGRKATITAVSPPGRFGALERRGSQVLSFAEKPAGDGGLVNGGFFVLDPSTVDLIDTAETIWERQPLERLAKSGELMAFEHKGFWQPMDTLRDKLFLEDLWQKGAPWKVW